MVLIDKYGRPLTHMRISVTLRCNHSCIFCHREGIEGSSKDLLSPEDYGFIAKVSSSLGIKYYKITGGEPLLRDDIIEIVRYMRPHVDSISITTNGSLLSKLALKLKEAGIDYINVSLHSLRPNTFKFITGGNLSNVLNGIREAINVGLKVKVDFLVLKYNIMEFHDILNFASKYGLDLNVIELIPLGMALDNWRSMHVSLDGIVDYLEKVCSRKYESTFQLRPTYILPTGIKVTVIRGYCNPNLCLNCTRIRLTPDGKLKICLYRNDVLIDILEAVKTRNEALLSRLIVKANDLREPYFKRW